MNTTQDTGRYATMTAAQVLDAQAELMARWSAEDAARRARNAAILAALDVITPDAIH
ncbi:MAG TPA: hypothetical protein VI172_16070 [Candidatus Dormibacteraeota bacterium]|jgi:hypothetical protein